MSKLFFSYIVTLLFAILAFIFFVFWAQQFPYFVEWQFFLFIGMLLFLLGSATFTLFTFRYLRPLIVLIKGMKEMLSSETARIQLLPSIEVQKGDEIEQVAQAFNELQEHFIQEYREVDKEMALASHIQQKLFPPPEQCFGRVEISCICQPIKEVGGDLYDLIPLPDQRVAIVIGDVSGNGLPAALLMSAVIFLLRRELSSGGTAGEVLTRLNQHIYETMTGEMFVTLALVVIDERMLTLEYACAGHVAPYILRAGQLEQVLTSTWPLGITPDVNYAEQEWFLKEGDRFFLYTDGVVDMFISKDEVLGFDRLEKYLLELDAADSLAEQMATLWAKIGTPKGVGHQDDRTAIFLRCS